jgi:hypothetical protein
MGNDFGVSPFQMIQMLGPMLFIMPLLLWLLVIGPLLIYPLARWKAAKEPYVDPQLGVKVALHYFKLLGFQLALLGALIIVWTIISKGSGSKGDMYRAGFGFLVPAGIVLGAHIAMLQRTNDDVFVTVRRLFAGYNLIITGLIGFAALVFGFQALFAKGSAGNEGRLFFAAILVYCGAWAACGVQFGRLVFRDGGGASSGPRDIVMPPPESQAASQAPTGPSLPSLGGGSFPPIDK